MKSIKTIIAAVALLGVSTGVMAQTEETDYTSAHNFVGLQAGGQVTLTHYPLGKLITPQYAIQFGRYFNDKVGARLHVMGYQNKTGFESQRYNNFVGTGYTWYNHTFKYKACTADLDLLLNMSNIINSQRKCHKFDWVMEVGFGVNYAWDYAAINDFASSLPAYDYYYAENCGTKHSSFNLRLGTQFNYNITDAWTVGLELQANDKNDVYNIKTNNKTDWQIAALVGVSYNFGYKKIKKEAPAVKEPVYATRIDTIWYDDVTYEPYETMDTVTQDVHFAICKSDVGVMTEINKVLDLVKTHKDCKMTVTGYADKGTGNPKLNMKYSKQRAQGLTKALVEKGVPAEIITTDWKGDTVQPYPNNDDNRVAIATVSGIAQKQKKIVTKKFRTKEVRYEVTE